MKDWKLARTLVVLTVENLAALLDNPMVDLRVGLQAAWKAGHSDNPKDIPLV